MLCISHILSVNLTAKIVIIVIIQCLFTPLVWPILSPAHEVGAEDIVITMSGERLCVRVLFPDNTLETVSRIVFILHTHIP